MLTYEKLEARRERVLDYCHHHSILLKRQDENLADNSKNGGKSNVQGSDIIDLNVGGTKIYLCMNVRLNTGLVNITRLWIFVDVDLWILYGEVVDPDEVKQAFNYFAILSKCIERMNDQ